MSSDVLLLPLGDFPKWTTTCYKSHRYWLHIHVRTADIDTGSITDTGSALLLHTCVHVPCQSHPHATCSFHCVFCSIRWQTLTDQTGWKWALINQAPSSQSKIIRFLVDNQTAFEGSSMASWQENRKPFPPFHRPNYYIILHKSPNMT